MDFVFSLYHHLSSKLILKKWTEIYMRRYSKEHKLGLVVLKIIAQKVIN